MLHFYLFVFVHFVVILFLMFIGHNLVSCPVRCACVIGKIFGVSHDTR